MVNLLNSMATRQNVQCLPDLCSVIVMKFNQGLLGLMVFTRGIKHC